MTVTNDGEYDFERYCLQCEKPIEAGSNYCKYCDEMFKAEAKTEESIRLWEDNNPKITFDGFNDDPYFIKNEVDIVEPEDLKMEPIE